MKSFVAFAVLSLCAANLTFAADDPKPAPASKPANCCVKAALGGKACAHSCCVEAAKEGKNCTKCGGSGDIEKKK